MTPEEIIARMRVSADYHERIAAMAEDRDVRAQHAYAAKVMRVVADEIEGTIQINQDQNKARLAR